MQHSIEKFLFLTLLGIFMFSLPVYLNASETDESGLLISQVSGEHKNEQTSSGPNNPHSASNVTIQSRWEKGIILGQFEDARYHNIELNLESGDRFLLYTDGIIEATNAAGDLFGWDHFKEFITSHARLPVGQFADTLIQRIFSWSEKHSEEALDDDLTLIVADFKNS